MDKHLVSILQKQQYQVIEASNDVLHFTQINNKTNRDVILLIAMGLFLLLACVFAALYAWGIIASIFIIYIGYSLGLYFIQGTLFDKEIIFSKKKSQISISYSIRKWNLLKIKKNISDIRKIYAKSRTDKANEYKNDYIVTFFVKIKNTSYPVLSFINEDKDKTTDYTVQFTKFFHEFLPIIT